jgi:hypothetical protein
MQGVEVTAVGLGRRGIVPVLGCGQKKVFLFPWKPVLMIPGEPPARALVLAGVGWCCTSLSGASRLLPVLQLGTGFPSRVRKSYLWVQGFGGR